MTTAGEAASGRSAALLERVIRSVVSANVGMDT